MKTAGRAKTWHAEKAESLHDHVITRKFFLSSMASK